MKNNLISAIAGWKSAALLALIAMVAAVAFSGVLTSTQTADAQAGGVSAVPGQTVTVAFTDTGEDRFRIDTDSEGSATFAHNGGQALRCSNDNANGCDVNKDTLPDGNPTTGISVRVTVDEDSPIGEIYVQQITRSPTGVVAVEAEVVVTVNRPNPPVALRGHGASPAAALTATQATPAAVADGTAGTGIGAQLVNARGAGIAGTNILVTTTRGVLNSNDNGTNPDCTNVSACTLTTRAAEEDDDDAATTEDPAGILSVRLSGNGATGPAEVTFRELVSGLTHTATVVLHGPAASISAAADQATIGVSGSTFLVVTVVDADGNPAVAAGDVSLRSNKPLVPFLTGPEVPAGSTATLLDYSLVVNKDPAGVANDIPSCGVHDRAAVEANPTADPPVEAAPASASAGTNVAGKCVIQVTAPANGPGPADDATRGTHTVTIGTDSARIPTVNVEVQVGGAPASMENDAPANVDSLTSTKITVTVLDDEGVRVGAVPVSVIQVEGSGNTDRPAGGDDAMTSDGRASFTFLAPLSEGEAVFLIRAGAPGKVIQSTITLAIGGTEEAPDAPPATWNAPLASGTHNLVWNGDDGADAADGAGEGVTAIWQWNGSGWDGYFPGSRRRTGWQHPQFAQQRLRLLGDRRVALSVTAPTPVPASRGWGPGTARAFAKTDR